MRCVSRGLYTMSLVYDSLYTLQVVSMLTNTIDRLFQRNPRYDGHRLLGAASALPKSRCNCMLIRSPA